MKRNSNSQAQRVILGVTGSIAAYKAVELLRQLVKSGFLVDVVLTEGAELFIQPLTFASLTNGKVYSLSYEAEGPFSHIELAKNSDIVLICPATASTINKIANGIGDNLLTTVVLASSAAKVICPSMNVQMLNSEQVQSSLKKLQEMGYYIVEPQEGELACGDAGRGRLADLDDIVKTVSAISEEIGVLKGRKVVVTSGPTREWIDDVRFISNASSGRMGTAIAAEAKSCGAKVTFITGPAEYKFLNADRLIEVESAEEMKRAVLEEFEDADILIMAAAVSDFTLSKLSGKIKKEDAQELILKLRRAPDILKELSSLKGNKIVVGFSLETENLFENAFQKLKEKNLDLVVANTTENFSAPEASALIIFKDGSFLSLEKKSKRLLAREIVKQVIKILKPVS